MIEFFTLFRLYYLNFTCNLDNCKIYESGTVRRLDTLSISWQLLPSCRRTPSYDHHQRANFSSSLSSIKYVIPRTTYPPPAHKPCWCLKYVNNTHVKLQQTLQTSLLIRRSSCELKYAPHLRNSNAFQIAHNCFYSPGIQ